MKILRMILPLILLGSSLQLASQVKPNGFPGNRSSPIMPARCLGMAYPSII